MVASTSSVHVASSPGVDFQPVAQTEVLPHSTMRLLLCGAHSLVAFAALAGGVALVVHPSGAPLGLTVDDLRGFTSFSVPGLLLIVFAWLQLGTAVLVTRRGVHGLLASQAGGAMLVLWTAFEAALVVPLHPLQLVTLVSGAAIYMVAHEFHRDEPHEPLLP